LNIFTKPVQSNMNYSHNYTPVSSSPPHHYPTTRKREPCYVPGDVKELLDKSLKFEVSEVVLYHEPPHPFSFGLIFNVNYLVFISFCITYSVNYFIYSFLCYLCYFYYIIMFALFKFIFLILYSDFLFLFPSGSLWILG
jgi:hypothetical protein